LIICLGPDSAVQPRDGFHVVIENVRRGIEHACDGIQITAKIRRQNLDARVGKGLPHLANGLAKMPRTSVRKIVAIDRGDHHITQFPACGGAGNIGGFAAIEREFLFVRRAFRNRAESAAARAEIAENHERRCPAMKALVHVGATRGFAHGVQIQAPDLRFERVNRLVMRSAFPKPIRQVRPRGRSRLELNQLRDVRVERQFSIFD
jgi:hypothetical protein